MKFFVALAMLVGLIGLHFCNSSIVERRLREGNNGMLRKSKGCNMLCSLKINFKKNNQGQQTCYLLPAQNNITISECVFNCLKLKGEKLENAIQCICRDGECIAPVSTSTTSSGGIISSSTEIPSSSSSTTIPASSSSTSSTASPTPSSSTIVSSTTSTSTTPTP